MAALLYRAKAPKDLRRRPSYADELSHSGPLPQMAFLDPSPPSGARLTRHDYGNALLLSSRSLSPGGDRLTGLSFSAADSDRSFLSASSSSILSSSVDSIDGRTEQALRYNLLKVRSSRANGGAGLARRRPGQFRSQRTDSESSSVSVAAAEVAEKQRETEHYNQLKLSVNRVRENTKVVRSLYQRSVQVQAAHSIVAPPVPTHSHPRMTSPRFVLTPPPAIVQNRTRGGRKERATGEETRRHRPSRMSFRASFRSERANSHTRYHNESHVNKIHSVSGSCKRSTSFSDRTYPRSRSTGDVNQISRGAEESGSESAATVVAKPAIRSHSFSDFHATQSNLFRRNSKKAVKTKSRSVENMNSVKPDATAAATPVSPGNDRSRKRSDGRPKRRSGRLSLKSRETRGKEEEEEEEGHSSESDNLTLAEFLSLLDRSSQQRKRNAANSTDGPASQDSCVRVPPPRAQCSTGPVGVMLIDPPVTVVCGSDGVDYACATHDFKVSVPKGAIKNKKKAELHIGVTLGGPFEFPRGTKAVSPILWLGSNADVKLKKPIEITLPHFLEALTGQDERSGGGGRGTNDGGRLSASKSRSECALHFLKASHPQPAGGSTATALFRSAKHRHALKPADGEEWFWSGENTGTLFTKHLGFFCIAERDAGGGVAPRHRYCLCPVVPRAVPPGPSWRLHYCLTHQLKSCIHVSTHTVANQS